MPGRHPLLPFYHIITGSSSGACRQRIVSHPNQHIAQPPALVVQSLQALALEDAFQRVGLVRQQAIQVVGIVYGHALVQ
jgi:hypothetical protein